MDNRQISRTIQTTLWTSKAVQELVVQKFGIVLSRSAMGCYLRSWGFSPQKPKKKAYEQKPAEVKKWLEEAYPLIKERAKAEKKPRYIGATKQVAKTSVITVEVTLPREKRP